MDLASLAFKIFMIVISVAIVIFSISVHEVAHGYVAYKLGDPTAKRAGRLTLNPKVHIDPFGSIILPLLMAIGGGAIFGYAKPVPYDPRYFEDIRKGEFLTALAGPFSNVIQALLGTLLVWILTFLSSMIPAGEGIFSFLIFFAAQYIWINLILLFFNIIPLPPLDGSALIAPFLSDKALNTYYKIQRYSLFILLLVLFLVPYVTGYNPLGTYLEFTAGNIFDFVMPS